MSYTMVKITDIQKFFKEDSRKSIKFLKEVQNRLKSSLPNCSQRTAIEVEKLIKECQNLFEISKLRYGRNVARLNKATVVNEKGFVPSSSNKISHSFPKHRIILKKPSVSMHKLAVLKEAISCEKQSFSSVKTTKAATNSALLEKRSETSDVSSPQNEICLLADDCQVIENVSKKRKQLDDNDQATAEERNSTVLHCEKKIKIEKKKITVAEYFARKRHENEMKICPINENKKKRKRALSKQQENNDNKNWLNALAGVLDAFRFNAVKKPEVSAA